MKITKKNYKVIISIQKHKIEMTEKHTNICI